MDDSNNSHGSFALDGGLNMKRFLALLIFVGYFFGCSSALPQSPPSDNECVRSIAETQIRATVEGVELCATREPTRLDACRESEIQMRANLIAEYVDFYCNVGSER